jgi:hypothetical protein
VRPVLCTHGPVPCQKLKYAQIACLCMETMPSYCRGSAYSRIEDKITTSSPHWVCMQACCIYSAYNVLLRAALARIGMHTGCLQIGAELPQG